VKKWIKRILIGIGAIVLVLLLLLSVSIYDLASDPEFVANIRERISQIFK